ncbi:hypothetical protein ZEAMMB73_Zm00001d037149 [Zea mays]|uniref:Uncharacterized protein n=1 Tax=Zea mays TaxID=4577 RepID=A0A1D6LUX3_MAIZE|nr:hypothetical protein ZEAMMB73_Zm00001d037149 [Zea mays]
MVTDGNVNLNTLMNMFSVLGAGGGLGGRNASNGSGPPCLRLPRDVHAAIAREQLRQPHRRVAPALVSQARVTVGAHAEEGMIHAEQPKARCHLRCHA